MAKSTPQVTAAPVNTAVQYGSTGAPEQTIVPIDPMVQLADELSLSFGGLSESIVNLGFAVKRHNAATELASFQYWQSLANKLNNNNESLAKLVEIGEAHPSENPYVMQGRSRAEGEAMAREFQQQTNGAIPELRMTNSAFADTEGALGWFGEESAAYFRSMPNAGGDLKAMEKAFNNSLAGYRQKFEADQRRYVGEKALEEARVGFTTGIQDLIKNASSDLANEAEQNLEGPSFVMQNLANQLTAAIDDGATAWGSSKWPLTYQAKTKMAVDALIELAVKDSRYTAAAIEVLKTAETGPKNSRVALFSKYAEDELLEATPAINRNLGIQRRGGTYRQAAGRWQDAATQMAVGSLMNQFGSGQIDMRNVEKIENVIKGTFDEAFAAQDIFDEAELVRIAQTDSEKIVYQVNGEDGESFTIEMDMKEITAAAKNEITTEAYLFARSNPHISHGAALAIAVGKVGVIPAPFKTEVSTAFDALSNFTLAAGEMIDPGFVAEQAQRFHERVYEPWQQLQQAGFPGRLTEDEGQEQLMDVYAELIKTKTPAEAMTAILQVKGKDLDTAAFSQQLRRLTVGTVRSPSTLDDSHQAHIDDIEKRSLIMKLIEPTMTADECLEYAKNAFDRDSILFAGRKIPRSAFNKRDADAVQEIQRYVGRNAADGDFIGGLLSGILAAVDPDVQEQLTRASQQNITVDYVSGRGYQVKIRVEGELPFVISNPFKDDNVFTSDDIRRISKAYGYYGMGLSIQARNQFIADALGLIDSEDIKFDLPVTRILKHKGAMPAKIEKIETPDAYGLDGKSLPKASERTPEEKEASAEEFREEFRKLLESGNLYGVPNQ